MKTKSTNITKKNNKRLISLGSRVDMAAILSFLYTVIYILILCKSGQMSITYDTAVNRSIAMGDMIGFSNARLLFINYVLGLILSGLYKILPVFEWFTLLLLFAIYFSLWAILYRVLTLLGNDKSVRQIIGGFLTICLFNFLFFENLMSIYFLNCAVIAGVAAFTYVVFQTELRKRDIVVCTVLMIICAGIRFSVFKEMAPFFILALATRLVLFKNRKRHLWLCGILVTIIGLMYVANSMAYTGIYAKEKEVNHYRAQIQDYDGLPKYETHEELYSSWGMSETDYLVMDDCWGLSEFLNQETLAAILEVNKSEHFENHTGISQIKTMISTMVKKDYPKVFWIMEILVFVGTTVVTIKKKDWKNFLFYYSVAALTSVEILYLAYKGRMPVRVTLLPLVAIMFGGIIYLLCDANSRHKKDNKQNDALLIIGMIVGFVLFVGVMSETKKNYDRFKTNSVGINRELDLIQTFLDDQENWYFCHGNHDKLDLYKPTRRNYTGWGGWISETIDWEIALAGEYDNVWEALAKRRDLRFNVEDSTMQILQQGLLNHGYDCVIRYDELIIDGVLYKIWRIDEE